MRDGVDPVGTFLEIDPPHRLEHQRVVGIGRPVAGVGGAGHGPAAGRFEGRHGPLAPAPGAVGLPVVDQRPAGRGWCR
jgi:hypothetical protein